MASPRAAQRLLRDMLQDIGRAEACRAGRTRAAFVGDGLRRDAAEQCIVRVARAVRLLEEVDPRAHRALLPLSGILAPIGRDGSVSRMDGDVLFGLIGLCHARLSPLLSESSCGPVAP